MKMIRSLVAKLPELPEVKPIHFTCLVLVSTLLFSLISVFVPLSGKSIANWLSVTRGATDILAYLTHFYCLTIVLFLLPFLILILFFGLTVYAASRGIGLSFTLWKVERIVLKSYLPFLILFWVPIASWISLIVAPVLVVRKLSGNLRKSILTFAVGLALFCISLSAIFFAFYLTADYELAGPAKSGTPYLVGYTQDGKLGVHGVVHDYTITYDNKLAQNLEIYQPTSFYETLPVSEVVLFSYLNMHTINGHLTSIGGSFPPRLSDVDNPPVKLYYIGYERKNEIRVLFFPFWKEQYFRYHEGDITPVMLGWRNEKPVMLLMSARSTANRITLLTKGLSNLRHGLAYEHVANPFLHGFRILYSGEDRRVMKYINPVEYIHSEIEVPAKIIVVSPWHTFEAYKGDVPAVRVKPSLVPLTRESFAALDIKYPAFHPYDITDPFAEPYTYINFPEVEPVWPEKLEENACQKNECIFLSPLWAG